jgi:hypothetical protein
MEQAVLRANREAALRHARLGNPVAAMRDGKVVWLQPDEVFALLGVDPNSVNSSPAGR